MLPYAETSGGSGDALRPSIGSGAYFSQNTQTTRPGVLEATSSSLASSGRLATAANNSAAAGTSITRPWGASAALQSTMSAPSGSHYQVNGVAANRSMYTASSMPAFAGYPGNGGIGQRPGTAGGSAINAASTVATAKSE